MRTIARLVFIIGLTTSVQLASAASALASDGIRILVLTGQSENSWIVSEFIDNAILDSISTKTGEAVLEIPPALNATGDTSISTIAARSQPLLVFSVEHLTSLEERLIETKRAQVESELQRELVRQVVKGLFQVPLWPYLAATEIPLRRIDIQRSWRLPDYRPGSFTATSYAATGDVDRWAVLEMQPGMITIERSRETGVGAGISLDYIVEGSLSDLHLTPDNYPELYAVYVDNGARFTADMQFLAVDVDKFIGVLENPEPAEVDGSLVSTLEADDQQGHIARMLIKPGSDSTGRISVEPAVATELPEIKSGPVIGTIGAVLICWIGFGILVLVGNLLFPFSSLRPVHLIAKAVALYPLYILLSMLTAGIWGMGFVIASVCISRFLAPEGRRLAATGVALAASFGITLISWLLVN